MKSPLRAFLLIAILLGPFSLFFILSKGNHEFKELPFLFEGSDNGVPPAYRNIAFTTSDGKSMTLADLPGKIKLVSFIQQGCPTRKCVVDTRLFAYAVFGEIKETPRFSDVVFISECGGDNKNAAFIRESMEITSDRWFFVTMPAGKSFFDVELNNKNPYTYPDPRKLTEKSYEHSAILLDRENRVRGIYDISRSIEFKRIMEEMRLLKKQYANEERERK